MATGARNGRGQYRRTRESAARDMRAAELHGQGWTYQRIAGELGFAGSGKACEAVQRAFASIPIEGAEQAKRQDLERLDRLIEKNWEALERPHVAVSNGRVVRRFVGIEIDADGIERLDADGKTIPVFKDVLDDGPVAVHSTVILRLIEKRSKIFGYDAPVQSRVEVITSDAVEANIARLEADLATNDPAHTGTG
ncbi:MAG TPA: hypothetical protein VHZ03_36950 [Trebonia sp.]|jgi:hypothetical protein|nr:hypothetical protein [Trebonia sp.]